MSQGLQDHKAPPVEPGPKYFVDIEGKEYSWSTATITTEDIIKLGGWDPGQGVIQIDADNNERTLKPGEVVELKPGHGFSKKIKWKRGSSERITEEVALLQAHFPAVDVNGRWIRIPAQKTGPGWSSATTDVVFLIQEGHPAVAPYGIYVPAGLRFNGEKPNNFIEPAETQPPFGGAWAKFSWEPSENEWKPKADVTKGANLLNWVLGFGDRFREGK